MSPFSDALYRQAGRVCGESEMTYNIWKKMRARCNNPKDDHFKWYGAKGISVCDRWSDFNNFRQDMGQRPSENHSIDRIDNGNGYDPGNCRWATQQEQNRNRAANTYITHNGKTQCLAAWSEELWGCRVLVSKRLQHGWNEIDAVTRPVSKGRSRSQKITNQAAEITKYALNASNSAGYESLFAASPGHSQEAK